MINAFAKINNSLQQNKLNVGLFRKLKLLPCSSYWLSVAVVCGRTLFVFQVCSLIAQPVHPSQPGNTLQTTFFYFHVKRFKIYLQFSKHSYLINKWHVPFCTIHHGNQNRKLNVKQGLSTLKQTNIQVFFVKSLVISIIL